jgi:predicted RNA-binding Zn ribbon-like protein
MVASGIAELPMVGGHPAIDLVNTVEPRLPVAGRHDHLGTPDDLLTWARRADLVDEPEAAEIARVWREAPQAAGSALASVIQIREALFTALAAGLGPDYAQPGTGTETGTGTGTGTGADQALDYLSLRWSAAMARSSLRLGDRDGPGARLVVGSAPALLIPDRAAAIAVDVLCQADLDRLGICPPEHEGCGWLFLDRSRNGSRRWCTMEFCGAQAKARRLTERRRADRVPVRRAPAKDSDSGSR